MLGLIPRPVHAIIDYTWGAAHTFAPELMGFEKDEAANMFCKARGLGATASSLLTSYELGLIKVIPFNMHLLLDLVSAIASLAAPKVLGFDKNKKATQAVLGFAIFEIVAVLLSKRDK